MPLTCAVFGCSSRHRKGGEISFHSFPTDREQELRWLQLCQRNDSNSKWARICSLHFSPEAFERNLKYELMQLPVPKKLVKFKKDAIPTLHLPPPQEPGTSGENLAREKQKVVSEILAKADPVKVLKLPQPASPPRDIEVVEVKEEPTCREEEPTCTEEDPEVLPLQEHDPLAIKPEPVPWQPSGSQEEPQPQESHAVYLKEEIDIKEEDISSFNTEEVAEGVTDSGESLFQGPQEETEELPLKRRKLV